MKNITANTAKFVAQNFQKSYIVEDGQLTAATKTELASRIARSVMNKADVKPTKYINVQLEKLEQSLLNRDYSVLVSMFESIDTGARLC